MRKLSLENLNLAFASIAAKYPLYLPQDNSAGDAEYKKWEQGAKWSDKTNTVKSPKDFFFPQTEDLMAFQVSGKSIDIIDTRKESEDFVVFGVRACDVKSFEVLDNVFLTEPADSYYASRREHGIIVSVACTRPLETCFCKAFSIDPSEPAGDVSCYKTDDSLYLSANTEKGEALLAVISEYTEEADDAAVSKQKESINKIMDRLPLASLTPASFGGGKTKEFFDAPEWKSLSEACLGCGTCTFVCPTCQCYDIKDFKTGSGVIRYRCWDSCMYSEFTKMSAGQPRTSQLERFRQRFMHKLVYYPENNNGLFSCVGCGRCLSRCPIHMNIVKVMKALGGKKDE
ncbi:MAG: 4Fe-4S dicluster domain-containing protein [Clostridia bacterium]|nr:4Fe-4S dicluster domain-containing protein [Clostridia bacterium]